MKLWICLLLTIGLQAAEQPARKKAQPVPSTAKAKEVVIPPGAVEIAPGTWTHTDAQGKKWRYRKTPFGVMRTEEGKPSSTAASGMVAQPDAAALEGVTAIEDGDSVRFERPSPLGTLRWRRKKSELSAAEQAALDRARNKTAAGKKDKPE